MCHPRIDESLLSRNDLIAIHGEDLQNQMENEARAENEAREGNEVANYYINLPNLSMRGLFAEYPELVTSGNAGRMWDWGWRATLYCRQMNIEHKVFALLMLDSHSDSTIPLDDAILQ